MRLAKLNLTYAGAIALVVVSLGLFAVHAGVWVTATDSKSETETENRGGGHRPSEMAGLSGMLLLVLTSTALCIESISPLGSEGALVR